MLMYLCLFLGSIFSCIQLCLLKCVGNGRYTSSDLHGHSYHGTHDRTSNRIGARSIVRSLDHSRVFIAFSHNTCFYCTIVANTCLMCFHDRVSFVQYFFICNYFGNSFRYKSKRLGRTHIKSFLLV